LFHVEQVYYLNGFGLICGKMNIEHTKSFSNEKMDL